MREIAADSIDFSEGEAIFHSQEDLFNREKIEQAVSIAVHRTRAIAFQIFERLPQNKQAFLTEIAQDEGLDTLDIVAEWFVQNKLVREIANQFGCLERSEINTLKDPTAFVAVTETGSILVGSRLDPDKRIHTVQYIRIPSRRKRWGARETTWEGFALPMSLRNNFRIFFSDQTQDASCLEYIAAIPSENPEDTQAIQTAIQLGIEASINRE